MRGRNLRSDCPGASARIYAAVWVWFYCRRAAGDAKVVLYDDQRDSKLAPVTKTHQEKAAANLSPLLYMNSLQISQLQTHKADPGRFQQAGSSVFCLSW